MKIAVISCHTPSLCWFRMDMMKSFVSVGCSVIAVGQEPEEKWADKFADNQIRYKKIDVKRTGINPFNDLKTLRELELFMKTEKPDKVFLYQAKTIIYGSIAAKKNHISEVYSLIAGLGSVFNGNGAKNFIVKAILKAEYKIACKNSKTVIFQNNDDRNSFIENGLLNIEKTEIINGSGVNIEYFCHTPLPEKAVFLFVGRLIKDKGVLEYLEACKQIKKDHPEIRCLLVGPYDSNPSAINSQKLQSYIEDGSVEYFGEQSDIRAYIDLCSVFVMPSYHEGTPKTVLEAMACGRAVITTDAPGCRETIVDGLNGYLIPIKNVEALISKMSYFIENNDIIHSMGRAGRQIAEEKYDVNKVNHSIMKLMNIKQRSSIQMLYEKIITHEEKISLVGLGYVGMPIAVSFAKKVKVIGFDLNQEKIKLYKSGIDPTREVGNDVIKNTTVEFTSDEAKLREAKFHIVAVPTPVNSDHTPDLTPVEGASKILGRNLTKGSIVVYESTVFPGVTEDVCVPILEKESGLKCGVDFKVGYSPERINPGDKVHRLETITKIVSGMDEETLDTVAKVYELVVDAGVHRAESIKVAEAAKVIENSQRDINIAFMNELSIIFNKMGIDTKAVLEAAGTKWNFLNFTPGLVGGHCIGVDPYYLTYKAEQLGYHSQIILSGRRINDDMGKYVAENLVKKLISADISVKNAKIAILGFTFKENCPDTRNSKIIDIVNELREYGITPVIADPVASCDEAKHEYGIEFVDIEEIREMDAVVLAVAHTEFSKFTVADINQFYKKDCNRKVLIDIKGLLSRSEYEGAGYLYWRL